MSESEEVTPVLVIHGGAWAIPDSLKQASIDGVLEAARTGLSRLVIEGSSRSAAVEAVQAAVESMESNPAFDAGYGSVLNLRG